MTNKGENRRVALTLAVQLVTVGQWENAAQRAEAALDIAPFLLAFLDTPQPTDSPAPTAPAAAMQEAA